MVCLPATMVLLPSRLHFCIELFVELMSVHLVKCTGTLLILVVIPKQTDRHRVNHSHCTCLPADDMLRLTKCSAQYKSCTLTDP